MEHPAVSLNGETKHLGFRWLPHWKENSGQSIPHRTGGTRVPWVGWWMVSRGGREYLESLGGNMFRKYMTKSKKLPISAPS